jgi:hypothetical protein
MAVDHGIDVGLVEVGTAQLGEAIFQIPMLVVEPGRLRDCCTAW